NLAPFAVAGPDITALVNQEIIFDAWESYDPNNDSLAYFWNFGDGATDTEKISSHIYLYPGQYLVSLMVSDGKLSDLDIITINIYNRAIIITEFMPDPEGKDEENEWIEIYNQSEQIANLTNWQLDDQASGSPPFIFPANSLIGPKQFLVLLRPITRIALNNDNDQVRLICPDDSVVSEVSYLSENQEGLSVAFDGLDYFWTKIPTPGAPNIISSIELKNSEENLIRNNPQPINQETQNPPEVLANNDYLTQTQASVNSFSEENLSGQTLNPQPQSANQLASLPQNSQSNPKSKLILIISIIISAALLVSWGLIIIRKY
ncbi:MAG: lamin tail domain-containing protein, partial [Patescibacteria group bacterium]